MVGTVIPKVPIAPFRFVSDRQQRERKRPGSAFRSTSCGALVAPPPPFGKRSGNQRTLQASYDHLVPNGYDRAYIDLTMLCASYRFLYREWPRRFEIHPRVLWGLADLFEVEEFERLAARLEIRTIPVRHPLDRPPQWMGVSGEAGTVDFLRPEFTSPDEGRTWLELQQEALKWLEARPREPREGEC